MTDDELKWFLQSRYEPCVQIAVAGGLSQPDAEILVDLALNNLETDPRLDRTRTERAMTNYIEGRIRLKVGDFRRSPAFRAVTGGSFFCDPVEDTVEPPPWYAAMLDDERRAVYRVVCELPDDLQVVIIARYWLTMSPPAIADMLRVPVWTVNSRLHRARTYIAWRIGRNPFAEE